MHSVDVPDPCRWLEDGSSDEVKRWMRDEDSFARAELAKLPLRASRMKELALEEQGNPSSNGVLGAACALSASVS